MSSPADTDARSPLEPCPFCGGLAMADSLQRAGYDRFPNDPDARAHFVRCRWCAAQGPWFKNATNAANAWNHRERQQEPERVEGSKIVYAWLNPRERHAEPLYFEMMEESEVEDGLEHIKDDPEATRCLLIPMRALEGGEP